MKAYELHTCTHMPSGNGNLWYYLLLWKTCTMATEACVSNFAVWRYMKSLFGTQNPWHNSYASYDLFLWKLCYHGNKGTCLYLCCLKVSKFHIWYTDPLRQQQSITWFVAMKTLLPWQQRHVLITLLFKGKWASYLVHRSLEATATHALTCWHGNPVTMATETYLCSFAVSRPLDFIFGTHVPWGNSNPL